MIWATLVERTLPLLGVVVGASLGHGFAWLQRRHDREQRRKDLLREAYVEWNFSSRIQLAALPMAQDDLRRMNLALETIDLLERDADLLTLTKAVADSIPKPNSAERSEFDIINETSPTWEWEPYDTALKRLKEALRKRDW